MPRNIELKARLCDRAKTERAAAALADAGPERIEQDDTFFRVPEGRLKLRTLAPDRGELIRYLRPDTTSPKPSHYEIYRTSDPDGLRRLLAAALGVAGRVRKERTLYRVGRTRIHLDRVEGLGDYLELEVAVDGDDAPGERTARELLAALGVAEDELVAGAYVDLLAPLASS